MYQKSIFWFRQDLRTHDNRGLTECIKNSHNILPIFILDEHLVSWFWWLTDKRFSFLREMLENLSKELVWLGDIELSIFFGKPEEIIPKIVQKYSIEAVYSNRSYGRYGRARDKKIADELFLKDTVFYTCTDYLLVEPEAIPTRKVFTPYFRLWKQYLEYNREKHVVLDTPSFCGISTTEWKRAEEYISGKKHPYFTLEFGRTRLSQYIRFDYENTRNNLDYDGTSKLSPYIRFWVFSIREIYAQAQGISETFISELAWREFWQHIAYNFPETKTVEFQENKRHIQWNQENELFDAWCRGETGYPIVDASMKQLLETNWMHGRSRMIVASFLTKDLHIDWRLGEKFFRKHLLDYDENVNFGNWQWSASVGADPKPLRIFNPSLQSEKFDPKARFILTYIPSLENELIKFIHSPIHSPLRYISPIVDHNEEQKRARELYRRPEIL